MKTTAWWSLHLGNQKKAKRTGMPYDWESFKEV
jgi:hypothetical protein